MSLKTSDLPPNVRAELARRVRDHFGSSQYDQMVGIVGEDAVLDKVLETMSGADAPGRSKSVGSWPGAVVGFLFAQGWWSWLGGHF